MPLIRVAFSLSVFIGSMGLGYGLSRLGWLNQRRSARLTQLVIKGLSPFVLWLSLWAIGFKTWRLALLPILGASICVAMLLPAWLYVRRARLAPAQAGSFLTCAAFSNVGYVGAFTAFALFGEKAYALCLLYLALFGLCFYTIGFAIARRYGGRAASQLPQAAPANPKPALTDDLRLYPFIGMGVGLLCNLLGLPRPDVLAAVNHVLIPLDTALYLIAIGSQLTVVPFGRWPGPSLAMSAIKFLYAPAVAWLLVSALGFEGLPRFVVLLEASTPVAVSPLIFPLLFKLDRELSNAVWLFTNVLAIPWLLLVIPLLQRL